jgi:hypothetical protein
LSAKIARGQQHIATARALVGAPELQFAERHAAGFTLVVVSHVTVLEQLLEHILRRRETPTNTGAAEYWTPSG